MEIIGIVVSSLDGYISKHDEEGVGFASEADRKFFRTALKNFDCCVFGSKTFLASQDGILRNLSRERLRIVRTRSPEHYAEFHTPGMLEFSALSPEEIIADLIRRGRTRCAVLGGSEVYTHFLANGLIHELWVTLEPQILGEGKSLVTERCDIALSLKEFRALDANTLLLKYTL